MASRNAAILQKAIKKISSTRPSDLLIRDPMRAACNRVDSNGNVFGYRQSYLRNRNALISQALNTISVSGIWDEDSLKTAMLSQCDERVVEYPYAAAIIAKLASQGKIDFADYGCVLNNPVMQDIFDRFVNMTWFLNISAEEPKTKGNIAHVEADIRTTDLHERMQFSLVTCLSTIEHIGMDNTRYGGSAAEFTTPPANPETFAMDGLRNLRHFVAKGGTLLVSVPYGPAEYVRSGYDPSQIMYYTFDKPRIERLASVLDEFDVTIRIFKVVPGVGWISTDLDDTSILRFGQGIASSGGVAILEAVRR